MNTHLSTMTGAHRVRTFASFDELRAAAPGMAVEAADGDIFHSWTWFENLARHGFDPGRGLVLALVERTDGEGAFCLPLVSRGAGQAAVFGPTLEGLSNFYSSLYGPLGDARHCTVDGLRALLRHLRREQLPSAVIDLSPLDEGSRFYADLVTALRAEGWLADNYFCFGNWHLRVEGRSFDEYLRSLPSRLRNTVRRGEKKLDAAGRWHVVIETAPGDALEAAIADFDAVYRKSWKVPEPFPAFVPELCRAAARQGWLRLGVLRLGELPIAAQLWLVRGGQALIYKLAYDEAHKRLSAGSVLSGRMMRHAIETDRCGDVDYLTGDDGYKVDWMSHRRERQGIVAFHPHSAQGLASAARHHIGRWARRIRPTPAPAPATTPATADD